MSTTAKRVMAISLIIVISILLGFAVDLIWDTAERATHPEKYVQYVRKYASEYNVPEPIVFAVIKVESDFRVGAESSAGACGLMQMMPSTFEWLTSSEHLGENLPTDDLFDAEVSIRYGVYYLNYLYQKFDRNWDTAFAAYNAGEGNVASWLADPEISDGEGNLVSIPFKETKNYVKRVNDELDTYRKLYYNNKPEVNDYEQ